MPEELFECSPENAPKFWYWVKHRGGIAKWKSIDLSNPGKSYSSPVNDKEGKPVTKPHWSVDDKPVICTDPSQIQVILDKEVKRFRVGVRRGSQGLSFKLTDASSRRLRTTMDKVAEQHNTKLAAYHFDYDTQEAVITVPDRVISLVQWATENPALAEKAETGEV